MWFGLLLLGCPSSPPVVGGSFSAAEAVEEGPVVRFADGSRLLAGEAASTAAPGAPLALSATFVPRTDPSDLSLRVYLWGAGEGEPAAQWDATPPAVWPGEAVRLDLQPTLPADLPAGDYWAQLQLRRGGNPVEAEPFGNGRVPLGVVRVGGAAPRRVAKRVADGPVLAVSGDVNLGRRMHTVFEQRGARAPLAEGVPVLAAADLAYVNLECAVGVGGVQGVDKGESNPFYYRARPETLQMLTEAGVDVVGVANNHAGDYGPDLLVAERSLLAGVGISMVGAGPDADQACAPVYRRIGELTAAFFAVDTTMPHYGAGAGPGTCYVDIAHAGAMTRRLAEPIREARGHADLVFVGIHWGANRKSRPTGDARRAGRELIDIGADAVLGSSAHNLQGIEVHRGRPILYDTGNLLFDSIDFGETTRGGVFELDLAAGGVERVTVTPLDVAFGRTTVAGGNSAARTLLRLRDLTVELGTEARFEKGRLVVDLPDPPPRAGPTDLAPVDVLGSAIPAPASEPPPGCQVDGVPAEVALSVPRPADGLVLLGARLEADRIVDREAVWLESWWTLPENAPARDHVITARVEYEEPSEDTRWQADHEPCDWGWPSSRWVPGAVYRDRYLLRPRPTLPEGRYDVTLGGVAVGSIEVRR